MTGRHRSLGWFRAVWQRWDEREKRLAAEARGLESEYQEHADEQQDAEDDWEDVPARFVGPARIAPPDDWEDVPAQDAYCERVHDPIALAIAEAIADEQQDGEDNERGDDK